MLKRVLRHLKHRAPCKIQNTNHSICYRKPSPRILQFESKHNLTFASKNLHISPANKLIYIDAENLFAHNFLPKLPPAFPDHPKSDYKQVANEEEMNKLLDQNWRASNATEITKAFCSLKDICITNNITLSDTRFDKLVDGLMDHCNFLTDEQTYELLESLVEYPLAESVEAHNFHDVWSCLDDICCWKMVDWSIEKMMAFANLWYKWHLGRVGDYTFECLDRATRRSKWLSKEILVHVFYFLNVCRKRSVHFSYEFELAKVVHLLTVEELAIVALGYFKTQSKIKLKEINETMIRMVKENAKTADNISLSAIMKALRFSQSLDTVTQLPAMLDALCPEIERLSLETCLHISLIGTGVQFKHDATLTKASQRLVENMSTIRLKEVERILNANSMFDFDPRTTPDLYRTALAELHRPERRAEIVKYSRCLPSALHYLSIRNMYSHPLTDMVLAKDFIDEVYGTASKFFPRELFSLDICVDVECPDYEGNRIGPERKYKAAKWLVDWPPEHRFKLRLPDKLWLDVQDHVILAVGGKECVRAEHVLPNFSRPDIVVCRDLVSGEFVEPFGFQNYILGDVKRPVTYDGRYQFFAIIVMVPNTTTRHSNIPLGPIKMKQRLLKAIGYESIIVGYQEFPCLSKQGKIKFFTDKLTLPLKSEKRTASSF